jgi:hypothetical protein
VTDRPAGTDGGYSFCYAQCPAVHVFDITQTDGEDLPDTATTIHAADDRNLIPRLTAANEAAGIKVTFVQIGNGAKGAASKGLIEIDPTVPTLHQVHTLCHEWAHHILHLAPDHESRPRHILEIEAESAAYICMTAYGYQLTEPANYIAIRDGTSGALDRMNQIAHAAQTIIDATTS